MVLVDTRLDRWAEVLAELPGHVETIVCGHTHMLFVRLAYGRQIINPGSVGMPYGRQGRTGHCCPRAGYHCAAHHSIPAWPARAACRQSSHPDVADWADYFLHARASDAEALTATAADPLPPTAAPPSLASRQDLTGAGALKS